MRRTMRLWRKTSMFWISCECIMGGFKSTMLHYVIGSFYNGVSAMARSALCLLCTIVVPVGGRPICSDYFVQDIWFDFRQGPFLRAIGKPLTPLCICVIAKCGWVQSRNKDKMIKLTRNISLWNTNGDCVITDWGRCDCGQELKISDITLFRWRSSN